MSLAYHRAQLRDYLLEPAVQERVAQDPQKTSRLIVAWWDSYKEWEKKDSVGAAYWDTRLAVRYSKRAINKGILSPIQAAKGPAGASHNFDGFTNDVGLRGIKLRMDPEVFMNTTTRESRKTELGLHDMNASLMKPGKPITQQIYISEESPSLKGAHFALIGLSKPEDQVMFALLNCLAKDVRQQMPNLYQSIRLIRSEMTRVKLACEHDMGSSYTAMSPDNPVNPKFRYYGKQTKVPDKNAPGKTLQTANTQALINERKMKALDFRKIINDQFTYNEIVVAYRRHANPDFPTFCSWNGTEFECFKLTNGGHVGKTIGTISNTPQR